MGEQETFGTDTLELNFIFTRLWVMCHEVWQRVQKEGFHTFRTLVVTVRFADFDTKSRSHTLLEPNRSPAASFEAMKLLMPFLDQRENPRRKLIRLIGVRVEKLEK